MEEKIFNIINQVRKNSGLEAIADINKDLDLREDLELDSISIAELITMIDNSFDVDINAGVLLKTVGDIIDEMQNY